MAALSASLGPRRRQTTPASLVRLPPCPAAAGCAGRSRQAALCCVAGGAHLLGVSAIRLRVSLARRLAWHHLAVPGVRAIRRHTVLSASLGPRHRQTTPASLVRLPPCPAAAGCAGCG